MRKTLIFIFIFFTCSLSAQKLKVHADEKGKCGYANEQGEVVIKCKYDIAFEFKDGMAKVGKGDKLGFIDSEGKEILPVKYEEITLWREGIYRIKTGKKYGLYSIKDGIITKPQYSCISDLNRFGKAIITSGGNVKGNKVIKAKIGILNSDGSVAIKPAYDKISEIKKFNRFSIEDIAGILSENKVYIGKMSKTEESVYEYKVKKNLEVPRYGILLSDTLETDVEYLCCYKGEKSAVVGSNGKAITPFFKDCKFTIPSSGMCGFRYGTTKVTTGYYNIETKKKIFLGKNIKIKKQILAATPFTGDIALVMKSEDNSPFGLYFINKNGEQITEVFPVVMYKGGYWIASRIDDGATAPANLPEGIKAEDYKLSRAMLDQNGNWVMNFGEYWNILPHNSGKLFTVMTHSGTLGVIDINKNTVIPFEYHQLGEPINGWYWAKNDKNKCGIIDENNNVILPFEYHNIFMNESKNPTNIWVRKEENGLWNNYDLAKKQIVGEGVVSSANFVGDYAWVVPQNQQITKDFVYKAILRLYPGRADNALGILIDKEGNHKTVIPMPVELFPDLAKRLKANEDKIRPVHEKEIIYEKIRTRFKHELSNTVIEDYWDF